MATTVGSIDNPIRQGDPVTWERPARGKYYCAEIVPAIFDYFTPKSAAILVDHNGERVRRFVKVEQLRKGHRQFFRK